MNEIEGTRPNSCSQAFARWNQEVKSSRMGFKYFSSGWILMVPKHSLPKYFTLTCTRHKSSKFEGSGLPLTRIGGFWKIEGELYPLHPMLFIPDFDMTFPCYSKSFHLHMGGGDTRFTAQAMTWKGSFRTFIVHAPWTGWKTVRIWLKIE